MAAARRQRRNVVQLKPLQAPVVYLNGQFIPAAEARVSVLDRGFLLGDGVYEVIPVYGRRAFRLPQHLQRLQYSLAQTRIPNPLSEAQWAAVVEELIAANAGEDQSLYLQLTRGVAEKRDHAFPNPVHPTVFLMSTVLHEPDEAALERGVAAVTRDDVRWHRCDIKAITLLANVLLRQEALDLGATEAILVRDGKASEGAASNLFLVADGMLITPPKGPQLLPGITRDLVLELAQQHAIAYEERTVTVSELAAADEIWLTSSTREIMPVVTLDGATVGDGRPGPVWRRLRALYQDYKRQLRAAALE